MKKAQILFEQDDHRWFAISRDSERPNYLIDTNEYVISNTGEALITNPGGLEIFPAVFSAVSTVIDPRLIQSMFASHQDPDVVSSLALWLEFNPEMKCHISELWVTSVPHFGGKAETMSPIADLGREIVVGSAHLNAIPAHYLHSPGCFHLYDPLAKILFSADIGSALLPEGNSNLFVTEFDRHIRFAESFHKRWMGSNTAKRAWCEKVASLKIDMICPQHGSVYAGEDVERFINWFDELHVGLF
ncbi:MBL fold metallo-hydrolase [Iodobacter arcticus]|uniref:MBL fold metallo-hydrolase n=1 Tax=Iodobacter arcticus TaxID=590593 RepID=A0ABW2QXR8_9NEIS